MIFLTIMAGVIIAVVFIGLGYKIAGVIGDSFGLFWGIAYLLIHLAIPFALAAQFASQTAL